jgi:hypothetical protein
MHGHSASLLTPIFTLAIRLFQISSISAMMHIMRRDRNGNPDNETDHEGGLTDASPQYMVFHMVSTL